MMKSYLNTISSTKNSSSKQDLQYNTTNLASSVDFSQSIDKRRNKIELKSMDQTFNLQKLKV
jgi:UTP:GlnB (protein PII) uridylyltransferase